MNIFDIIGPVMLGPSSSHTAGAARIALMARQLAQSDIMRAKITLYDSFATTGKGHGTHIALLGGLLGFGVDDPGLRQARELADDAGLKYEFIHRKGEPHIHPNTVQLELTNANGEVLAVTGISTGGGNASIISVNGVDVDIKSGNSALIIFHTDRRGIISDISRILAEHGINIAIMSDYRRKKGGDCVGVIITDQYIQEQTLSELNGIDSVSRAVWFRGTLPEGETGKPQLSLEQLMQKADENNCAVSDVVLNEACYTFDKNEIFNELSRCIDVMKKSVDEGLHTAQLTPSGLCGADAARLKEHAGIFGQEITELASKAMASAESNARMQRIVAAPTGGSCGILPSVLFTVGNKIGANREMLCRALLTAGGVGLAISQYINLSGAQGGCMAECGAAGAMAAAAAAELSGGSPEACVHAAVLAFLPQLGMTCDPVAGLVEYPCVMRNAFSAVIAVTACEMALAGIRSAVPPDQVLEAVKDIADRMPSELKETGHGGLCLTKTAERLKQELFTDTL